MKETVTKVIDTLTQEDFDGAFQKLLERYNNCIAAGGDYFEVDKSSMRGLSIKVPIRKKSGNLSNVPRIYIYIYIYIHICVCVCVCVCVREREKEREREAKKERRKKREKERERERVTCFVRFSRRAVIEWIKSFAIFLDKNMCGCVWEREREGGREKK